MKKIEKWNYLFMTKHKKTDSFHLNFSLFLNKRFYIIRINQKGDYMASLPVVSDEKRGYSHVYVLDAWSESVGGFNS